MISQLISGIVLAEMNGQDVGELVRTLANMPNALDGGKPFGEVAIRNLMGEEKKANSAKLERKAKAAEKAALAAEVSKLRANVESLAVDIEGEELPAICARCEALKVFMGVRLDGERISLTVMGDKPVKATGGGKPTKDEPRHFVSVESGERVIGLLTDWTKANVPSNSFAHLLKDGKLGGGKKLTFFLTGSEHGGPYLLEDSESDDFQAVYSAWKDAKAAEKAAKK